MRRITAITWTAAIVLLVLPAADGWALTCRALPLLAFRCGRRALGRVSLVLLCMLVFRAAPRPDANHANAAGLCAGA